jgi:hypothetical protein
MPGGGVDAVLVTMTDEMMIRYDRDAGTHMSAR